MKIALAFLLCMGAIIGYAYSVNAPARSLIPSAFIGACSYFLYLGILKLAPGGELVSSFVSSFFVGIASEYFSRKFQMPATIFTIPGLIVLVPGGGMYYTMTYLIDGEMNLFLSQGVNTFFIAVALSIGVTVSTIFSRSLRNVRNRTRSKLNLFLVWKSRERTKK
ncbi:MAG: threonine/serine exporter family protein [Tissierellia bacterium]|nr:threonine/serine exporter family protein [Tissierellia bacterium]